MPLKNLLKRHLFLILTAALAAGCEEKNSAAQAVAAGPLPAGNLVANPGFEQGDDVPAGWTFEERVRSQGVLRLATAPAHGGTRCLRLEPGASNEDATHPLAVGQGFVIDPYRGRRLQLSAWLAAEGNASAVAGLYAIRSDGSIAQSARLVQKPEGNTLSRHEAELEIDKETEAFALVLSCAAMGTAGAAIFDDVSITVAGDEREPAASVPAGEPLRAKVKVDAAREVRRIPRTLYGTNIEWVFDGYGLWDSRRNGLNEELVRLTRELQPTLIRFPGGVFSDFYHWRDGVGPLKDRKTTQHVPGAARSRHVFGTDEALAFARRAGGELLITVNAGTGTAAEAADWIRYVNKGGKPVVRYWEVGNELYGESPGTLEVRIPPARYAERFSEFAETMRAADENVLIGAIGNEPYGRYKMNSYPGWNREVLSRAAEHMDFFAVHNAYAPLMFVDRGEDPRSVYTAMLAAPLLIKENLDTVSDQIDRYCPSRREHIRLAVTEWGPWFHAEPSSRYVDHVKTMASALFVASTMKAFVEHPRMDIANAFKLVDNAFMGWVGLRDGRYAPKAPYYALQMYTLHFGETLVDSRTESPTFDSPAAGMVSAVKDVPWFESLASRSADGDTLFIMAINKHFDRPVEAEVSIDGFDHAGGTVWALESSAMDAHTGTELPKIPGLEWARQASDPNGRFHRGGPGEVRITSRDPEVTGAHFRYTFGPHSVTCLELKRQKAAAP